MSEKTPFKNNRNSVGNLVKSAALAAALATPASIATKEVVDIPMNELVAKRIGMDEVSVSKQLKDIDAKLKTIQENKEQLGSMNEAVRRMLESFRSGTFLKENKTFLESQKKFYEGTKIVQDVSYWVGLTSLWIAYFTSLTGFLYQRRRWQTQYEEIDKLLEVVAVHQKAVSEATVLLNSIARNKGIVLHEETLSQLHSMERTLAQTWGINLQDK